MSLPVRPVAILVSHAYWPQETSRRTEPYAPHQMDRLRDALAARGLGLEPVYWEETGTDWTRYAAVMPLMAWGYPQAPGRFEACLAEIGAAGVPLVNPPGVIAANQDKGYLLDLAARGAPVPPTLALESCTPQAIAAAFDTLACDEIVVKPRVGAGAWRQARVVRGAPLPPSEDLPPGAALVQPFLPSVASEGELSVLVFGGVISHALIKRPKAGDYRTQGHHGAREEAIEAPADALDAARRVLAIADPGSELTYARVDLVRGPQGWLLMELELIEPFLYLPFDGADGARGAALLADALAGTVAA
jgi:glutathione synthase/RimK-type ligase-like ATP-grasp enzyme